jgi:hypothetical protein
MPDEWFLRTGTAIIHITTTAFIIIKLGKGCIHGSMMMIQM